MPAHAPLALDARPSEPLGASASASAQAWQGLAPAPALASSVDQWTPASSPAPSLTQSLTPESMGARSQASAARIAPSMDDEVHASMHAAYSHAGLVYDPTWAPKQLAR